MEINRLLESLSGVQSPSGSEAKMKNFIIEYVRANAQKWKVKPQIIHGDAFQDCLILVFGKPEIAAFAHMDTTGFTVRYQDQLVPIGGPEIAGGEVLVGEDGFGEVECTLVLDEQHQVRYKFGRAIHSGTSLVYKSNFSEDQKYFTSPYLDNRIGILNLLKVAEDMESGALVFSCWEEHGGGSVPYLVKYLYEQYRISKILISDITWITDGVQLERGVVISHRDKNIPRKAFVGKVTQLAELHNIPYQIEVEAYGSSDAGEIQQSPYPIDWCFIGSPIENVHTDHEKISKKDVESMISFYKVLMKTL